MKDMFLNRRLSTLAILISTSLTASSAMSAQPQEVKELPHVFVLQAVVKSIQGNIVQIHLPGKRFPSEREMDISKVIYQTADGNVVAGFPIHARDHLIVIVNADKPLTRREPTNRVRTNKIFVTLQPLVIEAAGTRSVS